VTSADACRGTAVDIGVVTFNTAELTVRALRTLLDGDHGCEIRLLVRDNGSTDGTAAAIAQHVPEAELDAGRDNIGFAAGMNSMIARSEAPWFLALNSDAWPEPGAIATLVATGRRWPSAAAIAPRLERPDGTLEHSTHPFPSIRVAALLATGAWRLLPERRLKALALEGHWQHDDARVVDWAVGAALLMRREAIERIGGFEERFFMYAEDLEWCWRAHEQGWTIHFEPAALVRHVGNASGAAAYGRGRTAAYMRNTYRFYRSAHGWLPTAAYRAFNLIGAGRHYLASRARRRPSSAAFWAEHVRASLVSTRGADGPPIRGASLEPRRSAARRR
jgi:GT2 family glycosyltransferase